MLGVRTDPLGGLEVIYYMQNNILLVKHILYRPKCMVYHVYGKSRNLERCSFIILLLSYKTTRWDPGGPRSIVRWLIIIEADV